MKTKSISDTEIPDLVRVRHSAEIAHLFKVERIGSITTLHRVSAQAADNPVVTRTAVQDIVAFAAIHRGANIGAARIEGVVLKTSTNPNALNVLKRRVIAVCEVLNAVVIGHKVRAATGANGTGVKAFTTINGVVALRPIQEIIAGATVD